jgi:hypothetical protein
MGTQLVQQYVLNENTLITEHYLQHEILPGIYIAGTMDAITSSCPTDTWEDVLAGKHLGQLTLRDWKTSSTKTSSFSYKYKLQALSYCYLLDKHGIKIDRMQLCYATRPTKTLPVRVYDFAIEVQPQSMEFITGIINVIADSVMAWDKFPSCRYLLAHDYRLKTEELPD